MKLTGIHYSIGNDGKRRTTLHVTEPFDSYFSSEDQSRGCIGERVEAIYVGDYDCSKLKVGMSIDISYDKAITTAKGTFQPVKRIDVLDK